MDLGPRPREDRDFVRDAAKKLAAEIFAERVGAPVEVAVHIVDEPNIWIERISRDDEPDVAVDTVKARLEELEGIYGESPDWDHMRLYTATSLIAMSRAHIERAVGLLADVKDVPLALDKTGKFLMHMLENKKDMGVLEAGLIMDKLLVRLRALHSSEALTGALSRLPSPLLKLLTDRSEAELLSVETARDVYFSAPWDELEALAGNKPLWPDDMTEDDQIRTVLRYGSLFHRTFSWPEVLRKDAEALKAYVGERQAGREGDVWDRLRFLAVSGLYARSQDKLARSVARSMEPQMMAMVVFALLEDKNDALAMDLMYDIPDSVMFGKMLAIGEWSDRRAIEAIIEDLTFVASPRETRKHDPAHRLGTAQGVYEVYAERAEDDDVWVDLAEVMGRRVELLKRQIQIGYIKAPARKSK